MVSTIIPKILFSQYFWWTIAFVLLVAYYFARKKSPPPFPGAGKFFQRHEKRITKISDIIWICILLFWSSLAFFMLYIFRKDLSVPLESEPFRTMSLQSDRIFIFSILILWSGTSGFCVGNLSIFHSNITKIKRIVLLIVCLLPILFTVIQMLSGATENHWSTIQLCLVSLLGSWIINMPAVLVNRSFFELLGNMSKKVKLMFSHHAN
jgi:hypothetical protein